MRTWLAAAVVAALVLAGCSDDGDGRGDPPEEQDLAPQYLPIPEDPMPEGAGHDHRDASQHQFLWHYAFSDRDPLLQNQANIAGVHALDLRDGWLFGAVYGSHTASVDGGLVIWDAHTDPAHPRQVGRWTIPGSVGGDRSMEATSDAAFAVIATEPITCFGHINPAGAVSAYLIDARDKSRPVVADVLSVTGQTGGDVQEGSSGRGLDLSLGEHSVAVHLINGTDYAFILGKVYRIDRAEPGAKMVYVSEFPTSHDVYVRDTPWGRVLALSADGFSGALNIYDVTEPSQPAHVATWTLTEEWDPDGDPSTHYWHTADFVMAGEKPLVVISSEDFSSEDIPPHLSPLFILDGSPLRNVEPGDDPVELPTLGEWHNPGNHTAANLGFSMHNPRFHDGGLLTVSHYHGGLWQLDVRHKDFWREPAVVAYAVYAEGDATVARDPVEEAFERNLCGLNIQLDAPTVMDVEVGENGTLYAADVFTGLYTFTPTPSHPVYGDDPLAPVVAAPQDEDDQDED